MKPSKAAGVLMANILFSATVVLTLFVGCVLRQGGSPPPVHAAAEGTADSGGGNLFDGKPLESYIRDPQTLVAFQKILAPILKQIKSNAPSIELPLSAALTKKTWYFVPADLSKLSDQKIGSAVPTGQGALQDFHQVWIDSRAFDKMEVDAQARLILHEMLMGLRLLRFDSPKSECQAFDSVFADCMSSSEAPRGKPSDLKSSDYNEIRAAVDEILTAGQKLDFTGWDDLFARDGFSTELHSFEQKSQNARISSEQLEEKIRTAELSGDWPTFHYAYKDLLDAHPELLPDFTVKFPIEWTAKDACTIQVSVEQDRFSFQFSYGNKKVQQASFFSETDLKLRQVHDPITGEWVSQVYLRSETAKKNQLQTGRTFYDLRLNFSGSGLFSAGVDEFICTNADCSDYTMKKSGLNDICAVRRTIILQ